MLSYLDGKSNLKMILSQKLKRSCVWSLCSTSINNNPWSAWSTFYRIWIMFINVFSKLCITAYIYNYKYVNTHILQEIILIFENFIHEDSIYITPAPPSSPPNPPSPPKFTMFSLISTVIWIHICTCINTYMCTHLHVTCWDWSSFHMFCDTLNPVAFPLKPRLYSHWIIKVTFLYCHLS